VIRFKKIRNGLLMILGGLIGLMIILMGFIHYTSVRRSLISDYREKHLLTSLQASQSSLQSILERAIETSELLAEDPTLMVWFKANEKSSYTGQLVLQRLDYLHKSYNYASVFAVNASTLNYWRENYNLLDVVSPYDPDDNWFFEAIEKKEKRYLNFDYNRELKQAILFVNVLMGDVNDPIGIAGVGVDPSVLIHTFEKHKLTEHSHVWLIDNQGVVNMSEDISMINRSLANFLPRDIVDAVLRDTSDNLIPDQRVKQQKTEIAYMEVGDTGYKVVMAVPMDELLKSLGIIRFNFLWMSLLIFIITLVVVVWLSRSVSVPLGRLTFLAGNFAGGQLKKGIDRELLERPDEIGTLANAFETMKKQLTKVIEKVRRTNEDLKSEKQELVSVNQKLKVALEKASESDRLTRSFLANISHEIRTPMNSILGFAQLLELEDVAEKDRTVYAKRVVKGGQQLLSILDNVINLSKIDSGIIQPHWQLVDINQLMVDTHELFQATALQSGIQLIHPRQTEHHVFKVVSDPILLQQVLNNLLTNAIKFTSEGSVKLGYRLNGNMLRFYVSDTGSGIPPSQEEAIFEPFHQVGDSTINRGGAGLGLAISSKIAGILHGEIGIESTSSEGSTFYFSLPV